MYQSLQSAVAADPASYRIWFDLVRAVPGTAGIVLSGLREHAIQNPEIECWVVEQAVNSDDWATRSFWVEFLSRLPNPSNAVLRYGHRPTSDLVDLDGASPAQIQAISPLLIDAIRSDDSLVQEILAILRSGNEAKSKPLIGVLGASIHSAGAELLLDLVADRSIPSKTRRDALNACATALIENGGRGIDSSLLRDLIADPSSDIDLQSSAAWVLVRSGEMDVLADWLSLNADSAEPSTRKSVAIIARSCAVSDPALAKETLLRLLHDPARIVSIHAFGGLAGEFGSEPEVRSRLAHRLRNESDAMTRRFMENALRNYGLLDVVDDPGRDGSSSPGSD